MRVPFARFKEIGLKVMSDKEPITVSISIAQLWVLISGIQLATKHPRISQHMKDHLTHIANELEAPIIERHPESKECLDMGWRGR